MRRLLLLAASAVVTALFAGCALGGDSTYRRSSNNDDGVLTVVSASPEDGAQNVDLVSSISITFSESLDPLTVNSTSFLVEGDESVLGDRSVTGATITFEPTDILPYEATASPTVSDLASVGGATLASPYSWSFSTRDYLWQPPQPASYSPATGPSVALSTGTIFTAWIDTAANAWAASSEDGATWDTHLIENGAGAVVQVIRIATDQAGDAIATWSQSNGSRNSIWANRYVPGSGWGTAEEIDAGTVASAFPSVACQPDGRCVVVWSQQDAGVLSVWAGSYATSTGWTAPLLLENSNSGPTNLFGPGIACSIGSCMAVWSQSDGATWSIWANCRVGLNWQGEVAVSSDDPIQGGVQYGPLPFVSVDSDGNALVVWLRESSADIWANAYRIVGAWQTSGPISGAGALTPTVALAPSGQRAVAAWPNSDGSRDNLLASTWTPAGGWGAPGLVDTEDLGNVSVGQKVLLDPRGNGIAVWRQFDGARNNVWARRFLNGTWGTASVIEFDDASAAGSVIAGMDPLGRAAASWNQNGYRWATFR